MASTASLKIKKKTKRRSNSTANALFFFGSLALFFSVLFLVIIFLPAFKEEVKYSINKLSANKIAQKIVPIDTDFGIVIPKILANSKVVDNVDPYNSKIYQQALSRGVAHAQGTAYPGHVGNTFIFAHSSADWFTANKYNSVFYLLNKLENKDQIQIYYKEKKYIYEVFEKKIVEANDTKYLNNSVQTSTLTLMTCWPPGTTFKRLIIQAKIK